MEFKTHFIAEYENILAANGGTTMGQEGHVTGGVYSAIDNDRSYLADSIVQYDKRATQAKGKANELESRLAALEMGPPPVQRPAWLANHTHSFPDVCPQAHPVKETHQRVKRGL